jgi:hypothetical protein
MDGAMLVKQGEWSGRRGNEALVVAAFICGQRRTEMIELGVP